MDKIKVLLRYIDGKKTLIAAIYWEIVTSVILIWFPQGLPDRINKIYLTIGVILT